MVVVADARMLQEAGHPLQAAGPITRVSSASMREWMGAAGLADVPVELLRDGRAQAQAEHTAARSILAQTAEATRRAAAVAAAAAWRKTMPASAPAASAGTSVPAAEPAVEAAGTLLGAAEIEARCREIVTDNARQHARGAGRTILLLDCEGGAHGPVRWLAATAVSVLIRTMLADADEEEEVELPLELDAGEVATLAEYIDCCSTPAAPPYAAHFSVAVW